jgi:hypothetical protein
MIIGRNIIEIDFLINFQKQQNHSSYIKEVISFNYFKFKGLDPQTPLFYAPYWMNKVKKNNNQNLVGNFKLKIKIISISN